MINTPEEGQVEKSKQQTPKELLNEATKKFSEIQFKKDETGFYDKVFKKNEGFFGDFQDFIKGSTKYSSLIKYTENNQDEINAKIKIYTSKLGIGLETRRKTATELFSNRYELTSEQKGEIEKKLKIKTIKELDRLLNFETKRDEFLKKEFKEQKPIKIDFAEVLIKKLNITKLDIDKNRNLIDDLQTFLDPKRTVYPENIEGLLKSNIFDTIEKKQLLIKMFLPTISLQKLIDWGVINKGQAGKFIDAEYEKIYEKYGITEENFDLRVGEDLQIEPSDIIISTFTFPEDVVDKILENDRLSNFIKKLNEIKKEIQEEIKKTGPQNLDDFKTVVGEKLLNKEKFQIGGVIKITKTLPDKTTQSKYFKIINISPAKEPQSIVLQNIGEENTIYNRTKAEKFSSSYQELFKTLKEEGVLGEVFSQNDITSMIKDPSNLLQEEENLFVSREEVDLQEDIDILNDSLKELEEKGLTRKDEEFIKIYDQIQEKENKLDELSLLSFEKLQSKIDIEDPEGKAFPLQKGSVLNTKDWTFYIYGIDNGLITVKSSFTKLEPLSYKDFFESFKTNKAKRGPKFKTTQEYIDFMSKLGDNGKKWENHREKDGKIIYEDKDSKKTQEVEYLVTKDSNDIIKINKIAGDRIVVQFGERKDEKVDEKDKKKGEREVLYIKGAKKVEMSLNEFWTYTKDKNFYPSYETGKAKQTVQDNATKNEFHGDLLSKIFNKCFSVAELIAGGKMITESITESLKKLKDVHSAKVALALGKFLPEEIRSDLKMKVEGAEAEQMDKELKSLKSIDSSIATARIRKWLLNTDTPEYKKEAGMLFMLENYGVLYSKKLAGDKGDFLWYTAFGGKKGDKMYMKYKKECEEGKRQFTEEELLYNFMNYQCKELKIRRSRLYKEYDGKWKPGMSAEHEKGQKDANNKRSVDDRVKGGIDELKSGNYPNAGGWLESALNKGGSIEKLNKIPFVIMFSGVGHNMYNGIADKLKNFMTSGKICPFTRFLSYTSDIDLFNQTVVEISKRASQIYGGEYSTMGSEAEKIMGSLKDNSLSEPDRIEKAEKFWEKYGTILSRSMHLLNNQDSKFTKTDKIIFFEKDTNPVFAKYYETLHNFMKIDGKFKEEVGEYHELGLSGTNLYEAVIRSLALRTGGGLVYQDLGRATWNDIKGEVNKIKNGNYDDDLKINDTKKRALLKDLLRSLIGGVLEKHGSDEKALKSFNYSTSIMGGDFNEWGIKIHEDFFENLELNSTLVMEGKADSKIDEIVENILSGRKVKKTINPVTSLSFDVKNKADGALNKKDKPLDIED